MGYADPRPFWLAGSGIVNKSILCSTNYGLPSTYMMLTAGIGSTLALEVRGIKRWLITVPLALVYMFFMGYVQVLVGAQDYGQVLYGTTLGIWVAVVLRLMETNFYSRVSSILSGASTGSSTVIGGAIIWLLLLLFQFVTLSV